MMKIDLERGQHDDSGGHGDSDGFGGRQRGGPAEVAAEKCW